MAIRNNNIIRKKKEELLNKLKEERAFWSYDDKTISLESVNDDQLIAMTMRYLDLQEIKQLFEIFSYRRIKNAWKNLLVPEGKYLYTLNRFFAWYYFNAKKPDAYLKSLQTRHLNSMIL